MKKGKILSVLLSLIMAVSTIGAFAACDDDPTQNSSSESIDYPTSLPNEDSTFVDTGKKLVENGRSEYKIVVPEGNDSLSAFAASELTEFIRLSTGVTLETVPDTGLSFHGNEKYISVGETSFLKSAGITVSKEDLGESGYVLKTVGDSLFVASVTASNFNGSLYGVYDFLEYTIGLKIYAADEVVYEKMDSVPLYAFNESFRPSIDIRTEEYKRVKTDRTSAYRLRLIGKNIDVWSSFTHTLISDYLPKAKYFASHPDWYASSGEQLCLTNEEMISELVVQVQERLTRYPDTTRVMLGHEDNTSKCECENCMAVAQKYGGAYSGVELELTNKVAKAVDKWAATAYPGRKISYYFFAYTYTLNAPVTYVEATDSYTLNYEQTEILDNVGVLIAPIAMNFSKAPDDPENMSSYRQMKGWSALFNQKNIAIWHYSLNAYSYFFNFNNFGVAQEYYRFYEEIGTSYIFDQGNYDSCVCTFEDMRIYVQSQLMWDSSQSYEELADEFMNAYYGLAAPAVKKYYQALRAHYAYLEQRNMASGTIFFLLDDKNIWPIGVVNTLLRYLEEGLVALEPLKAQDYARYEVLYSRVQKERLSPLYMMLSFYIGQLSDDVRTSYVTDFEKYTKQFQIEADRESGYGVAGLIESWKKA